MRIDRNIQFFEDSQLRYQLRIHCNHQMINESYATYDEAVKARDEIEANYRETGELAHSSSYVDGKVKLARSRYQSDDLRKTTNSSGQTTFSIDTVCKQCNRKHTYRMSKDYHQFLDRGQRCRSCLVRNRYDDMLDIRYSIDEPYRSNLSTGVKNVSFNKARSKYRVDIVRRGVRVTRFADTLNEAIAIKERILDFYKDHDRLPTHDEV